MKKRFECVFEDGPEFGAVVTTLGSAGDCTCGSDDLFDTGPCCAFRLGVLHLSEAAKSFTASTSIVRNAVVGAGLRPGLMKISSRSASLTMSNGFVERTLRRELTHSFCSESHVQECAFQGMPCMGPVLELAFPNLSKPLLLPLSLLRD